MLKIKNNNIDSESTPSKKTLSFWVNLAVPIVFAIFMGMASFIGNGFSEDIKEIKGQIKEVDNSKVDNETLQLMIKNQAILIEHQKEESQRKIEEDAKKFEQIQQTQNETLKQLQLIQMQRYSKPISVGAPPSSTIPEKDPLTPEEFDTYIKMEPEVQVKYKRYLEKIGKDISGLP